ncbi:prepilin peptidase [Acidimangrovimonas sediminis]|uniref:prepilin peptidase n=1 Tax=Acidimangrovimonas sediminis TaxID=2056283 RepID=UPI000C7FC7A2|nr:prepilin peptidase [Acidimangrovimonas sediminis]
MLHLPHIAALCLLIPAVPIGIWVAWNDMKFMKIPNIAVLALVVAFVVIGPFVLPLDQYLWQLSHLPLILLVGFVLNVAGLIGAGDAKFAAAMAPFFTVGDLRLVIALAAAILLGAFAAHRLLGLVPSFRHAAGDWQSWQRRDFPMGLALSGILIFYLALAVRYGA